MDKTNIRQHNKNLEERLFDSIYRISRNCTDTGYDFVRAFIPFLVLRRLDCVLESYNVEVKRQYMNLVRITPQKDLDKILQGIVNGNYFYNVSGLSLTSVISDPSILYDKFNRYIAGFNNTVKEILNLFDFDKIVIELTGRNLFLVVIQEIVAFDLGEEEISQSDLLAFFNIIIDGCKHRSFYATNRSVIDLIDTILFEGKEQELQYHSEISIYDPACGTGGMLFQTEKYIKQDVFKSDSCPIIKSYGQEISEYSLALSKSIELMLGNNPDLIKLGNTLIDDQFSGQKFDFILSDLPYGMMWKAEQQAVIRESLSETGRFKAGVPTVSDSQMLFIQHILDKMKPSGSKVAIITNESPLIAGSIGSGESNIRKWIVDNDLLEAIIALPEGMLDYTKIPTYLWIFNNIKGLYHKDHILLIDAKNISTSKNVSGKKLLSANDINEIYRLFNSSAVDNSLAKLVHYKDFGFYQISMFEKVSDKNVKPTYTNCILPLNTNVEEYANEYIRKMKNMGYDLFMDKTKTRIGYSFNFNQFFTEKLYDIEENALITRIGDSKKLIEEGTSRVITFAKANEGNAFGIQAGVMSDVPMQKSDMQGVSEIPEKFDILPLNAIFDIFIGNPMLEPDSNGEYPIFGSNGVKDKSNEYSIDGEYILIGRTGSAGKVNYFSGRGNLSQGVYGLKLKVPGILRYFYYQLLQLPIDRFITGASIKSLAKYNLEQIRLIVPPIEIQKNVVAQMDTINEEKNKLIELLKSQQDFISTLQNNMANILLFGKNFIY